MAKISFANLSGIVKRIVNNRKVSSDHLNEIKTSTNLLYDGPNMGRINMSVGDTTDIDLADTYYKINGTFGDGVNTNFTLSETGILTFTGTTGLFLVNGVSDLAVNQATTITYGLFINDTLVPGVETPHDFTSPAKTTNISVSDIALLTTGDKIDVWSKASDINTELTVYTLKIVFWGVGAAE